MATDDFGASDDAAGSTGRARRRHLDEMRVFLETTQPASTAEGLRLLRERYPDVPLSDRLKVIPVLRRR